MENPEIQMEILDCIQQIKWLDDQKSSYWSDYLRYALLLEKEKKRLEKIAKEHCLDIPLLPQNEADNDNYSLLHFV